MISKTHIAIMSLFLSVEEFLLFQKLRCVECVPWRMGQILVHSFWIEYRSVSQLTCRRWQEHGPMVSSSTLNIPNCVTHPRKRVR